MDFNTYQELARKTAIYPKKAKVIYPTLGLTGEAGEVAEKIKKQIRDHNGNFKSLKFKAEITKELGDALWYIANLAKDLKIELRDIAKINIIKLQ